MVVLGYGISMDVESLAFAVLDGDQSPESRDYLQSIAGSRYFVQRPPIHTPADLDRRLRSGELALAIEIPPDFGQDVKRGRSPEVGVWVDGAMPFRGETIRGYVQGVHQDYLAGLALRASGAVPRGAPVNIEMRYRYNQDFRSLDAMVPAIIPLLLLFIPSILTALAVVREKELGSITNLYVTPVTRLEFLLGKQLPYVAVAMLSFFVSGGAGGLRVPGPAQGKPRRPHDGGASVRRHRDRLRPADVRLHSNPDRRPVRDCHRHADAGHPVLGPHHPGLVTGRGRARDRGMSSPRPISSSSAAARSTRRSASAISPARSWHSRPSSRSVTLLSLLLLRKQAR